MTNKKNMQMAFITALLDVFRMALVMADVIECEYDFPTVEAKPVKHGRWVKDRDNRLQVFGCAKNVTKAFL